MAKLAWDPKLLHEILEHIRTYTPAQKKDAGKKTDKTILLVLQLRDKGFKIDQVEDLSRLLTMIVKDTRKEPENSKHNVLRLWQLGLGMLNLRHEKLKGVYTEEELSKIDGGFSSTEVAQLAHTEDLGNVDNEKENAKSKDRAGTAQTDEELIEQRSVSDAGQVSLSSSEEYSTPTVKPKAKLTTKQKTAPGKRRREPSFLVSPRKLRSVSANQQAQAAQPLERTQEKNELHVVLKFPPERPAKASRRDVLIEHDTEDKRASSTPQIRAQSYVVTSAESSPLSEVPETISDSDVSPTRTSDAHNNKPDPIHTIASSSRRNPPQKAPYTPLEHEYNFLGVQKNDWDVGSVYPGNIAEDVFKPYKEINTAVHSHLEDLNIDSQQPVRIRDRPWDNDLASLMKLVFGGNITPRSLAMDLATVHSARPLPLFILLRALIAAAIMKWAMEPEIVDSVDLNTMLAG